MAQETPVQPRLDDLMNRYLQGRVQAQAAGWSRFPPDEVLPYEASPVQPVDAAAAWSEASAVYRHLFGPDQASSPPSGWSALVASREPVIALAFSLGNYPQLLRDFSMVLQGSSLERLRPAGSRPYSGSELEDWAAGRLTTGDAQTSLLAAGLLRLAGHFEQAEKTLAAVEKSCTGDLLSAWVNERGAWLWHRGDHAAARACWGELPPGPARSFNLGMADLFLGNRESAREHLQQAAAMLPETSAWHHLARLYLGLAD